MANETSWVSVCDAAAVPDDSGVAVLVDGVQIAVFHIAARDEWYAVQNRCPHWNEMVLARGLTGEQDGEVKLACPMHKKSFHLGSGACLTDGDLSLETFPVRLVGDQVQIRRPSEQWLAGERELMTSLQVAPCDRKAVA